MKARTTSEILSETLTCEDPGKKNELNTELWESVIASGTPIVSNEGSKTCDLTFFYEYDGKEDVLLDSEDLYDILLDEKGSPQKFQNIPGTNTYFLQIKNVPKDAFATYNIQVGKEKLPDTNNKKNISLSKYELKSNESVKQNISYILPEAKLPPWTQIEPPEGKISGSIKNTEFTPTDSSIPKRDIITYRPENWESIPAEDKRVVFLLDGESLCKTLTPYLDKMSAEENNPCATTAFVFIDSGSYPHLNKNIPGRVHEYYYFRDKFAKTLGDEIIKEYCEELKINNGDNVILAAHSLAAYPILKTALTHTDKIGGIILMSPALNQNKETGFSAQPQGDRLAHIPIYMQIGTLEDSTPPKSAQDKEGQDMKDQSRLKANREFYDTLKDKYNVQLHEFSSGHSINHSIDAMQNGLKYMRTHGLKAGTDPRQISRGKIIPDRNSLKAEVSGDHANLEQAAPPTPDTEGTKFNPK